MNAMSGHAAVHPMARPLWEQARDIWWASNETPDLGPVYSYHQQTERESHLDRFLLFLEREFHRIPRNPSERQACQERIFTGFGHFAQEALDWEERHVEAFREKGFMDVGVHFARQARGFDSEISAQDIFQAHRNVWTMNGLQAFFGQPVRLTPSVFAYSMLYPCSDNLLDDPVLSLQDKREFNRRFRQKLEGDAVLPSDGRERSIFQLVDTIESEFPRTIFPPVWEGLLTIHRAQEESIQLQRPRASPYEVDVLGISFAKGGASVLADGYLVAKDVSPEQAQFLYGLGCYMQLADDLQDVIDDRKAGILTVFSQTATRWPLDGITNRLLTFGARVAQGMFYFPQPDALPFQELLVGSLRLLVISAVGAAGRLYSREYVEDLERHSPFRFSALHERKRRLARLLLRALKMLEAFASPTGA
jgi:hypothetical protein